MALGPAGDGVYEEEGDEVHRLAMHEGHKGFVDDPLFLALENTLGPDAHGVAAVDEDKFPVLDVLVLVSVAAFLLEHGSVEDCLAAMAAGVPVDDAFCRVAHEVGPSFLAFGVGKAHAGLDAASVVDKDAAAADGQHFLGGFLEEFFDAAAGQVAVLHEGRSVRYAVDGSCLGEYEAQVELEGLARDIEEDRSLKVVLVGFKALPREAL